jgi:amino acid transporter
VRASLPAKGEHNRLAQIFGLGDLVPLSVSSVGPLFSVAATGGVMAADAGWWTLPAILLLAVPFIVSSFVFRLLNRHFPHAGASYHWSARIIGRGVSRYQAWVLILAYFTSIPPIAIPASSYTLALVAPGVHPSPLLQTLVTLFWIAFAAVPLLLGGRPTAKVTKVFLAIELASLVVFAALGLADLHRLAVPVRFGPVPVGGMLVVAVVAATILDGWEIDSYAAEESHRPRSDPGFGGIVGAFLALGFYGVLYPLMFAETPLRALAGSSDPLAVWGLRLAPGARWLVLVPVLASTAGGLWLTTFILTRALYAMGRERLIPAAFGRVSRRRVPSMAILVSLGATLLVCALQLFVASLAAFFGLVLSAAGFFLLAEFFLDSVTATVFLTVGHRRLPDVAVRPHDHRVLRAGAIFSSAVMGALLVLFFVYGPRAIGSGIDEVLAVLLALGLVFALATRRRTAAPHVFPGDDAPDQGARAGARRALPVLGRPGATG